MYISEYIRRKPKQYDITWNKQVKKIEWNKRTDCERLETIFQTINICKSDTGYGNKYSDTISNHCNNILNDLKEATEKCMIEYRNK